MPSRFVAAVTAVALALALAGCANMTRNQQGLAMFGGAAVVVGGVVMIDGWTCDDTSFNSDCEHDGRELLTGAIVMAAGGALLWWTLSVMRRQPSPDGKGSPPKASKQ